MVPEVLFWELRNPATLVSSTKQGGKLLGGFSYNLFKLFLEHDADLLPNDTMKAAIAVYEYQSLVVVE